MVYYLRTTAGCGEPSCSRLSLFVDGCTAHQAPALCVFGSWSMLLSRRKVDIAVGTTARGGGLQLPKLQKRITHTPSVATRPRQCIVWRWVIVTR